MDNPFHYGSAVTGERFTNRSTELKVLVTCMVEGQNAVLLSPRRYGKTSVLKRAAEMAGEAGARVGMANLVQCSTRREVAEELATAIARSLTGKFGARLEELGKHLAELRPSFSVEAHGVKVSLAPQTPESDWTEEIKSALRALGRARKEKEPVALVIDEFQRTAEINQGLPGVFKAMVDELEQVSLVFAGSRRSLMEELSNSPGAPLLGIGQRINLLPIASDDMIPFLVERASSGGKRLPRDVASFIYETANGVPNHVQQLAFWTFAEAGKELNRAAVERALATVLQLSIIDFTEAYEKVSPVQQRLLRALAEKPAKDMFSGRFVTITGVSNPSGVGRALRRLEDLELIELGPDGWRVANPFLARWLQTGSDAEPNEGDEAE
ncbi:MAG: AAA family ATPase [Candidatus Dormibacteraceae bacterium]